MEGPPVILGLPPWRLILFVMTVAGSLKGVYYLLAVSDGKMPVRTAIFVGIFNAVSTTINSLLFAGAATSAASPYLVEDGGISPWPLPRLLTVSCIIFAVGIFAEAYSEIQRKALKLDPRNRGKPYTGGLFSLARHINYGGYTLWKSAYGLASAGWWWGAITMLWLVLEFKRRAIPGLDAYCQNKYGAAWMEFKRTTRYKLLPFIY